MPLNIKDPATEKVVRELAALTHRSVTETVRHAAEAELQRTKQLARRDWLIDELRAIRKRAAALPVLDPRTPDEILGYDENGLPS